MIKKILKRLLGNKAKKYYLLFTNFYLRKFPSLFSKSRFLSSLYYFFFSKRFRAEQQAMLSAKLNHYNYKDYKPGHIYHIRRNIHRLEKGLAQKYRRNQFAISYILETIQLYRNYVISPDINNKELKWFNDILDAYFKVVDNSEEVLKYKDLYFNVRKECGEGNIKIPYLRSASNNDFDYAQFKSLALYRKSIRWYLDKEVEREKIDKAIELALLAPSACNRQAYTYYVIDNKELAQKIAKISFGTKGFADDVPVMVAIVGHQDAYFEEWDRHLIFVDTSLSAMNFMLALETLGLSSCPINWPDIESKNKELKKILNIGKTSTVTMLISLGYSDESQKVAYSDRAIVDRVRRYVD